MSSAVAELEAGLQAMLALKPPGVSRSRIDIITNLCNSNVSSESVLIQKLYTHFKKAPGPHKLGVLYVVDSVTRKWTEQAKNAGQPINSEAQDGTFAAGVHRVKELLPVLMNDIIHTAPDDQKEKIKKLLDIWEKGQTFPLPMLTQFKARLKAPTQNSSTTPPGSPPLDLQPALGSQVNQATLTTANVTAPGSAASAPNTLSVLEALANMARQNSGALTANQPPQNVNASAPLQNNPYPVSSAQSNPGQQAAMPQGLVYPPSVAPPVSNSGPQNYASNMNPIAGAMPLDPAVQTQLWWIKVLSEQGFPPDKIAAIIAGLPAAGGAGGMPIAQAGFPMQNTNQGTQPHNGPNGWGSANNESRDRNGIHDRDVPPGGRQRGRSRSLSPQRGWSSRDSPTSRRRDDYDYGRDSPGRGRADDRGGRGRGRADIYRQRSPQRRRSRSPVLGSGLPKWIGHDASVPRGSIKVLSRTLFVGGVTMSEGELRSIFNRYGQVQTCIVNKDKRHAFVKMMTREDALNAKDAMEKNRTPDSQLRTRWGVGFGPRECSDYQTGVSVIPISKLTDADKKWMLSAEYGGSGGKPIETGMVVEEPDIEIGQGVSSKAISRRMQTDKSGDYGPRSGRDFGHDGFGEAADGFGGRRDRTEDRRDARRDDDRADRYPAPAGTSGAAFQLPAGFPYMPSQGSFPMFPPGFVFPGQQTPQQPPAPGRT